MTQHKSNCKFQGCERPATRKSACKAHYEQARRGKPLTPLGAGGGRGSRGPYGPRANPQAVMIASMFSDVDEGACWEWGGARDAHGYGRISRYYQHLLAHRVSWEQSIGALPEGAILDHMCFVTSCVNPAHLRIVTHQQNMEHRNGAHKNSRSGVRGVYAARGRWRATVGHNGVKINLGTFGTIEEADEAARLGRAAHHTHGD